MPGPSTQYVVKSIIPENTQEDGFIAIATGPYLPTASGTLAIQGPVTNLPANVAGIPINSVFSSIQRVATGSPTGMWQAVLKEGWPCNMNGFDVTPVIPSGTSPARVDVIIQGDNVGCSGTTNASGSLPQVVNFQFCQAGVSSGIDLPVGAGFRYHVSLQNNTAYYKKVY